MRTRANASSYRPPPYNKTYLDLSSQLRIFVEEDQDLGIRPERLLRQLGEIEFSRRHQAAPRTLAAFDFSEYADDWRDLMRLYLVRRTRSFIQDNYAEMDQETGRKFLTYEDGTRSFFPTRVPKTVKFAIDDFQPQRPVRQAVLAEGRGHSEGPALAQVRYRQLPTG